MNGPSIHDHHDVTDEDMRAYQGDDFATRRPTVTRSTRRDRLERMADRVEREKPSRDLDGEVFAAVSDWIYRSYKPLISSFQFYATEDQIRKALGYTLGVSGEIPGLMAQTPPTEPGPRHWRRTKGVGRLIARLTDTVGKSDSFGKYRTKADNMGKIG